MYTGNEYRYSNICFWLSLAQLPQGTVGQMNWGCDRHRDFNWNSNLIPRVSLPPPSLCCAVLCCATGVQAVAAAGMPYPANGRPYSSGMRSTSQSVIKRQKVSQGEAPNPVVFVATKDTRSVCVHVCLCESA